MKINNRLKTIGDLVPLSSYPLDIGCDHALLSIYLVKEKNIPLAVASDNKSGPLQKAKENVKYYQVESKIKLIQKEGLDSYQEGIDTVTISGMGGLNIIEIFYNNKQYLKDVNTIILSPNNNIYEVRKELTELGYYIDNEIILEEKNKIYNIIVFKKGKKNYNYKQLLLGPILINKNDQLISRYFQTLIDDRKKIIKKIGKCSSKRKDKILEEIKFIEETLIKK